MGDAKKPRRPMRPVTDETRQQVRQLHAEGLGRNEIARRLDRSPRTISVLCEEMGLLFDRTATAVATEARKVDAKARRLGLIERAYARAEKLFARLEAAEDAGFEYTATSGAGIQTVRLDHVPGIEEKALAGSISQYLSTAARLEAVDADTGIEAAQSMLGSLAAGLTAAYEAMNEGDGDAP